MDGRPWRGIPRKVGRPLAGATGRGRAVDPSGSTNVTTKSTLRRQTRRPGDNADNAITTTPDTDYTRRQSVMKRADRLPSAPMRNQTRSGPGVN